MNKLNEILKHVDAQGCFNAYNRCTGQSFQGFDTTLMQPSHHKTTLICNIFRDVAREKLSRLFYWSSRFFYSNAPTRFPMSLFSSESNLSRWQALFSAAEISWQPAPSDIPASVISNIGCCHIRKKIITILIMHSILINRSY